MTVPEFRQCGPLLSFLDNAETETPSDKVLRHPSSSNVAQSCGSCLVSHACAGIITRFLACSVQKMRCAPNCSRERSGSSVFVCPLMPSIVGQPLAAGREASEGLCNLCFRAHIGELKSGQKRLFLTHTVATLLYWLCGFLLRRPAPTLLAKSDARASKV